MVHFLAKKKKKKFIADIFKSGGGVETTLSICYDFNKGLNPSWPQIGIVVQDYENNLRMVFGIRSVVESIGSFESAWNSGTTEPYTLIK